MEYEKLFSPMKIGSVTVKNRVVMAPMLLGFGQFDGSPTPRLTDYYEERAKGGVGLIITEITRVNDRNGASAFAQLGMSQDYQIAPMKEMVDRVHRHGTKIFIQLHHPGRQNLGLLVGTVPLSIRLNKVLPFYQKLLYKAVPAGKVLMEHHMVPRVLAPSKCERSYFSDGVNRALRKGEIKQLIGQFVGAAERVKRSGADGVELHAAHGYLIQQFLSPNTNRRKDEYGGSLENRMRFLLEIIDGIRKTCGADFPIVVRLTVDECYDRIGQPGKGLRLPEGIEIAKRLEKAGVDALDISSAAYDTFNFWLEPPSFECGWRAYMAQAVKKEVSVPVLAANLIRSPEQAERQLRDGVQDFVSLGRPLLADPHWAKKVAAGNENAVKRCVCCLYCIESMQNNAYTGSHGKCSVNPFLGREAEKLRTDGAGRTVVVAGAGPGGLTAAEILAKRGFRVVVLEREARAGGQVRLAENVPYKSKLQWCAEDLYHAAAAAGAEFRFNTEANRELIESLEPYAVVVATGGSTVRPGSIPGVKLPEVCTVTEVLNKTAEFSGKRVAVIGSGMTGLETAELLAERGNKVYVVEMAKTIAPGTWMQHRDDILPRLKERGVEFLTSKKLVSIRSGSVTLESVGGGEKTSELICDRVVLSLGVRSENALYNELKPSVKNLYIIGDACRSGRIAQATESAYQVAAAID